MVGVRGLVSGIVVYRHWPTPHPDLFDAVRSLYSYGPGEDRATGYLYSDPDRDWPAPLAPYGLGLLADLELLLGVRFPVVAMQAYRNGAGCGWHTDDPWDAQAVLSLGVTRTFGIRPIG